jgi:hypothetical protein
VLTPDFTRRDLHNAATPEVLAHGRELAERVEDLGWDEYSLWGCLPDEGISVGELLVHHAERPLTGECPCPEGRAAELCAHMAALALAFLGDDTELADRLAAVPHGELVALVVDLADRSAGAHQMIQSRLAR